MSEREKTSSEAFVQINRSLQALNLKASVRYVGEGDLVAIADLYDEDNRLVETGAGKGPDALVGALAESLEHYGTFNGKISLRSHHECNFIANQRGVQCDGILYGLADSSQSLECFRLTTLNDRHELFVPCALLCPAAMEYEERHQETRFLNRYASNSGIAFGCSKAEALLHGTLEVIERHLLSRLFMSVCAIAPAMILYSPSKQLLAAALLNNPYALEAASRLQIIITKDELGVYFSMALPKNGPGDRHISPIGSGCSLNICIAVQRAVTEQFQSSALYDSNEEPADRRSLDQLSTSETLRNLIDFAPIKDVTFKTLGPPSTDSTLTVAQQVIALQQNLKKARRQIFHRTIEQYSHGNIVTQTYVPGLERFNIIRNGHWVAPQHILLNKTKTPPTGA